ncbi:SLC39A6 [Cordylochernes scorpioides]|uniref:SLC39A6 n=1 Tax=Cordylochernes scorpioides TaxID=51811 RepID=A0ABY6LYP8_9ARAC|nr:SLC39A6 [Cordylochernes scorpioides]
MLQELKKAKNLSYSNATSEFSSESLHPTDSLYKCMLVPFNNTAEISPSQFSAICPALLFHLDAEECDFHNHSENPSSMTWLYATVSISAISLSGLLAVSIIPIMQRLFYQSLLQFLVGLAIGSLSGDALLHLLPHAMTHHEDGEHNHDLQVWRGVAALGGAYLFFIAERILNITTRCQGHSHHVKTSTSTTVAARKTLSNSSLPKESEHSRAVGEKLSHHSYGYPVEAPALESLQSLNPECCESDLCGEKDDGLSPACDCSKGDNIEWDNQTLQVDLPYLAPVNEKQSVPATVDECHRDTLVFRHDETDHSYVVTVTDHHHHHAHGDSISSVGIMVIIGDALHNFCDGLAIGKYIL